MKVFDYSNDLYQNIVQDSELKHKLECLHKVDKPRWRRQLKMIFYNLNFDGTADLNLGRLLLNIIKRTFLMTTLIVRYSLWTQ